MAARARHAFFRRDPVTVARTLLGQRLVRVIDGATLAGRIVETEAYLGPPDRAAHSFGGRRTARNESMYLPGGHAYVYFTYGMHHCVNVVAGNADEPVAVLIRALEPVEGLEHMRTHRPTAKRDTDLCSGPGKLCQALRIDRSLDGLDLATDERLRVELARRRALPADRIVVAARVGIDYAGAWKDKPLRFFLRGNPHVSVT